MIPREVELIAVNRRGVGPILHMPVGRRLEAAALGVGIFVILAGAIFVGVPVLEMAWSGSRSGAVEKRYGFRYTTPYVNSGTSSNQEVFVVQSVLPGGALDRAGVRPGEIVLEGDNVARLLIRMDRAPSGGTLTLTMAPGGDGAPVATRPHRTATLLAP